MTYPQSERDVKVKSQININQIDESRDEKSKTKAWGAGLDSMSRDMSTLHTIFPPFSRVAFLPHSKLYRGRVRPH